MLKLYDGMTLYHGSYTTVSGIDLSKCRQGKDFGRGFYVTSSYEQACGFVSLSISKQINRGSLSKDTTIGFVSVFRLHLTPDVKVYTFDEAGKEWLHFVASNRRNMLFPEIQKSFASYDIIGGKIANDRTAQTLQLYISGGYGSPGSDEADEIAIRRLLPNRLEDQFCFCSPKAVETLSFVRSEEYAVNT